MIATVWCDPADSLRRSHFRTEMWLGECCMWTSFLTPRARLDFSLPGYDTCRKMASAELLNNDDCEMPGHGVACSKIQCTVQTIDTRILRLVRLWLIVHMC